MKGSFFLLRKNRILTVFLHCGMDNRTYGYVPIGSIIYGCGDLCFGVYMRVVAENYEHTYTHTHKQLQ